MKSSIEITDEMEAHIRQYVPKWKKINKADSALHKAIGFIFDRFMDYTNSFWTTIGFTTAHPPDEPDGWGTMSHEGIHGLQAKRWTRPLFGWLYAFPQAFLPLVAVVLALVVSPWFWFGCLSFLLPLPAPWRAAWELEAYKVSVMVWEWRYGAGTDIYIRNIARRQFAGLNYLCMWPFPEQVERHLTEAHELAKNWQSIPVEERDPYLEGVFQIIKAAGRLSREY